MKHSLYFFTQIINRDSAYVLYTVVIKTICWIEKNLMKNLFKSSFAIKPQKFYESEHKDFTDWVKVVQKFTGRMRLCAFHLFLLFLKWATAAVLIILFRTVSEVLLYCNAKSLLRSLIKSSLTISIQSLF